jgi:hypothetical protein
VPRTDRARASPPAPRELVLCGIAAADYHSPTVCTEFDVTQLADHLIGSVTYFGAAARAGAGAGLLDRLIAFTSRTINQ